MSLPNTAGVALIFRGEEYLVVWNEKLGVWALPGGKTAHGDADVANTMVRELFEETGVLAEQWWTEPLMVHPSSIEPDRVVSVFLVTQWRKSGKDFVLESPDRPVRWMTREQLLNETPFREYYARLFLSFDTRGEREQLWCAERL